MGPVVGFIQAVTFTLRNFMCKTPNGPRAIEVYNCDDAEGLSPVEGGQTTTSYLVIDGQFTITVDNSLSIVPTTHRVAVLLPDGVIVSEPFNVPAGGA